LAPDFEASESSRRFNSFLLLQKCTVKRFLGLWQFIIVSFSRQLAFSESGVAGRLAAFDHPITQLCVASMVVVRDSSSVPVVLLVGVIRLSVLFIFKLYL
jgi:hypothetical protein